MNPIFSIIMPVYNSAKYIRRSIESVLNQNFDSWELIIINDGSTDKSLEIINEYCLKDSRIKIFSKLNGGYCSAINLGLEKISGKYFMMLGSDDFLQPWLFDTLLKNIKNTSPDIIAFKTINCNDKGKALDIDKYTNFCTDVIKENISINDFEYKYPKHAEILFTRDTSKCFKRELLDDLRYFGKYGIDADGIFSMLLCHKAKSFAAINTLGYCWVLRSNSLSSKTKTLNQTLDISNVWKQYEDYIIDKKYILTKHELNYLKSHKSH